ncbi:hypothetical protein G7K_0507-t1 [Saitoella complicata NRRL Y-17804]|uniref:Uncharacterized protein n=1 Tax=Saitoella complicata (strain BCRC 22490 / CBS 7301 / JCM 7358 / NBRC 10748 / NRRL Y-17804) TaxID=698492 RepID=A0A0E9N8X9_SAICN|nr:hypothetical protein G7K_0507-t1 [Saitoella complicata NRRL Y-17804]
MAITSAGNITLFGFPPVLNDMPNHLASSSSNLMTNRVLTRHLLDIPPRNIRKTNHTNRLPNTQPNPGRNTPIQPLHTIILINIPKRTPNRHLRRTIRVSLRTLHLNPNNLNRLIPRTQPTTNNTRSNPFGRRQLFAVFFVRGFTDPAFRETRESDTRAPVCALSDGDGVDAFVDSADSFAAVDVEEGVHRAWGFHACRGDFVAGDFDCFHTCAESHLCRSVTNRRVGLRDTTTHTTEHTRQEGIRTRSLRRILQLTRSKQQHSSLRRSLNPGPWDQTLVETLDTTTPPSLLERGNDVVLAVCGHVNWTKCLPSRPREADRVSTPYYVTRQHRPRF